MTMHPQLLPTLALLTLALSLRAAEPTSLVTSNQTWILPSSGTITLGSLTIATNVTLTLAPATNNAGNPPAVLQIAGDVVIHGTLDVNGRPPIGSMGGNGGPGGFYGGSEQAPGTGPGAGTVGAVNATSLYLNPLLIPLIGGSGGAGDGGGGGGGGGALLLTSGTSITVNGVVIASGARREDVSAGSGSGGAIRLVAPRILGTGRIATSTLSLSQQLQVNPGRIRIDALETNAMQFRIVGPASFGKQLYASPPNLTNTPTVQITRLLSQPVPALAGEIVIPVSSAQQDGTIEVQTAGFAYVPTVTVAVHPEGLNSTNYTGTPNGSGLAIIPITIPSNAVTRLQVWAR